MKIYFSPARRDVRLEITREGDALALNDQIVDFSGVSEGDARPAEEFSSDWLAGEVRRIDGEIHLTVILPHSVNAPEETRFPQAISAENGPVPIPPYETTEGAVRL
ncbi:hypothetical protein RYZ20_07280 [Thioclava sp. A2]|uniref:hypothetical protein n=1 Tax=Thioclava sp. FCG-A2 TaxID=3080562 RepID=UPI002954FBDD|nr:hypothetical protein [Thioclava sp. A2]MDV7270699.1 hypothetical protein [Thioclava sp. A2]